MSFTFQKNSKILIIGGTHGNEYTGIDLVKYLQQNLIINVDQIIANLQASELNLRFVETNLQLAFGVKYPISSEELRAVEISKILPNYDFIFDFHNTIDQNMTCGIVTCLPNDFQIQVCKIFGITKIIQFPPGNTLIGQNPEKSISIEISSSDMNLFKIEKLRQNIIDLQSNDYSLKSKQKIEQFKFIRTLPKSSFDRLFPKLGYLYNFLALNQSQKKILNFPLKKDIYPVFRGAISHFTSGLMCSFVEKVEFEK